MYFHHAVRDAKRAELAEGLTEALAGPFNAQTRHLLDRELVSRCEGHCRVHVELCLIAVYNAAV